MHCGIGTPIWLGTNALWDCYSYAIQGQTRHISSDRRYSNVARWIRGHVYPSLWTWRAVVFAGLVTYLNEHWYILRSSLCVQTKVGNGDEEEWWVYLMTFTYVHISSCVRICVESVLGVCRELLRDWPCWGTGYMNANKTSWKRNNGGRLFFMDTQLMYRISELFWNHKLTTCI